MLFVSIIFYIARGGLVQLSILTALPMVAWPSAHFALALQMHAHFRANCLRAVAKRSICCDVR